MCECEFWWKLVNVCMCMCMSIWMSKYREWKIYTRVREREWDRGSMCGWDGVFVCICASCDTAVCIINFDQLRSMVHTVQKHLLPSDARRLMETSSSMSTWQWWPPYCELQANVCHSRNRSTLIPKHFDTQALCYPSPFWQLHDPSEVLLRAKQDRKCFLPVVSYI